MKTAMFVVESEACGVVTEDEGGLHVDSRTDLAAELPGALAVLAASLGA